MNNTNTDNEVEIEIITDEPDAFVDAVLPYDGDPKLAGFRLHVFAEVCGVGATISWEKVHPEQVANPEARHVVVKEKIDLTSREVAWLRDRLTEIADSEGVEKARHAIQTHREVEQLRALIASLEKVWLDGEAGRGLDVLRRVIR